MKSNIKLYLLIPIIIFIFFNLILGEKAYYSSENEIKFNEISNNPHISYNIDWQGNGIIICASASEQVNPQLISDDSGGAIIAWNDYRSGNNWDIYAQRVNKDGVVLWTENGKVICNAADDQVNPQFISDGVGGAIIAWHDDRSGGNWDIYAQRINKDGAALWTGNGKAICNAGGYQEYVQIVSDGVGGAIIAWQDYRNGGNSDLYAQRINSTGSPQWIGNGKSICDAPNSQFNFKLVSNVTEGAIIAWQDRRNGDIDDIYAQKINSTGDAQWTDDGIAICNAPFIQSNPQLIRDGKGGAIITWQDRRSGTNLDIYAQLINATGIAQWGVNGKIICDAADDQGDPQLVSDESGGAIIVWHDYRSGISSSLDIYAQRINNTGSPQWIGNGKSICSAIGQQNGPQPIIDDEGGVIIVWEDSRSGSNSDIYAQQINATGDGLWAANGISICKAIDTQRYPQLISDGVGGAIIVWEDYRNEDITSNIYAQSIKKEITNNVSNGGGGGGGGNNGGSSQIYGFDMVLILSILSIAIVVIGKKFNKYNKDG